MKKLFLLCWTLVALTAHGQGLNYDFEALNADGSLRNWGGVYLFIGGDSVVFDQYFITPTPDAHRGSRAVELRNAFDYTGQFGIAGSLSLDTDSVYSAWGNLELVPVTTAPVALTFWHRYFPVNGDTASALLQVYDSTGTEIGSARAVISGTVSAYTLAQVPLTYHTAGTAAYLSLNFTTFYTALPGQRQPSLGTRLLIDDVSVSRPLAVGAPPATSALTFYPNPATDAIRLEGAAGSPAATVELFDTRGRLVLRAHPLDGRVAVGALPAGLYLARLHVGREVLTRRLLKQ